MSDVPIPVHPVQTGLGIRHPHDRAVVPQAVTLRAYEVYCHLHGEQPALITGECRGGFSDGELVAFLYAHTFMQSEWRMRVNEALRGSTL